MAPQRQLCEGVCHPLGCLVLTLATPGYGKPSLLSPNEVRELLRQFGKVSNYCMQGCGAGAAPEPEPPKQGGSGSGQKEIVIKFTEKTSLS